MILIRHAINDHISLVFFFLLNSFYKFLLESACSIPRLSWPTGSNSCTSSRKSLTKPKNNPVRFITDSSTFYTNYVSPSYDKSMSDMVYLKKEGFVLSSGLRLQSITVGKAPQQKLDNWSHSGCTPEAQTNDHERSACFLLSFSPGHQVIVPIHRMGLSSSVKRTFMASP